MTIKAGNERREDPEKQDLSVEAILNSPTALDIPTGWVALSPAFFASLTPDQDLTTFFNGGEPSWEAVVNPELHRIQLTESLLERTRRRMSENKSGIELLIGPTGEGKTTALRQAAAAFAQVDGRTVLWRQQPNAQLDKRILDTLLACSPTAILVSDSSHLILEQLHELVKDGHLPQSSGLQLVLASRDTDWNRRARELGFKSNPADIWRTKGPIVSTKHPFGRVSEADARKIVRSWRALEPSNPHTIEGLSDSDAAKLLSSKSASAMTNHGALLGGLLAVRYTPEELRAHLADLLENLSGDATAGEMTLADVVIVLTLADVAELDGIPSEIIAEFCNVDEFNFASQVANRLGKEAVANYSADVVRARHPMISEAVFEIVMSDVSAFAVESAAIRLLEAVKTVGTRSSFKGGYGQILGLGRELYKAEITTAFRPRLRKLGVILAKKACELDPNVLSNHMALSECLRSEKQAAAALASVWEPISEKLLDKPNWQDWNKNCRIAVNEFAIAASLAGDEATAAILRMAALSDNYQPNRLEAERAAFTLSGLSLHLTRLHARDGEQWQAETLAAIDGCIRKVFSFEVEMVGRSKQYVEEVGCGTTAFENPGKFLQVLDKALEQMKTFTSDYLDTDLWIGRIGLQGLNNLLLRHCENRNG